MNDATTRELPPEAIACAKEIARILKAEVPTLTPKKIMRWAQSLDPERGAADAVS